MSMHFYVFEDIEMCMGNEWNTKSVTIAGEEESDILEKHGQNLPITEATKWFVLDMEHIGMPSVCSLLHQKCFSRYGFGLESYIWKNQYICQMKMFFFPLPGSFVYYSVLQDSCRFLGNQVNCHKMGHCEA